MMAASTLCLSSLLLVFSVRQHRAALPVEPVTAVGVKQLSEYQSSWVWQNGRMTEKRRQNHILSKACRNIKSNSWQEITPNPAALNMNHHNELCIEVLLKTVQKLCTALLVKSQLLPCLCLWQHITATVFTGTQVFCLYLWFFVLRNLFF